MLGQTCFLGDDDGCCMIGVEPLVELYEKASNPNLVLLLNDERSGPCGDSCERLDKSAVVEPLTKLFEEVLLESTKKFDASLMGEEGAPCVTSEAMRTALRGKVAAAP